jgi:hypothetical protein
MGSCLFSYENLARLSYVPLYMRYIPFLESPYTKPMQTRRLIDIGTPTYCWDDDPGICYNLIRISKDTA